MANIWHGKTVFITGVCGTVGIMLPRQSDDDDRDLNSLTEMLCGADMVPRLRCEVARCAG